MVCVGNTKKIVPFSINGNFDFMTSGGSVGERNTSVSITQNLPQISLDEGLEKSVQWYIDNRHWLKEVQV